MARREEAPTTMPISAITIENYLTFGTPLGALKRVRLFIENQFGVRYSDVHVWRLLGQMGFSSQKPERRALERDEAAIQTWKKRTWPALKKARREGRLIIFVDES